MIFHKNPCLFYKTQNHVLYISAILKCGKALNIFLLCSNSPILKWVFGFFQWIDPVFKTTELLSNPLNFFSVALVDCIRHLSFSKFTCLLLCTSTGICCHESIFVASLAGRTVLIMMAILQASTGDENTTN
eukprot:TRINITY_DN3431_c0_g1_i1.p1 TRINITY_DN3431_c0_g1~~TRINITY_DN3431_c0_g1_i1.p1  ORF type:complete len:131 (-),score=6.05 TRINITY_DN3431_c0_g1_i1:314-706(-)